MLTRQTWAALVSALILLVSAATLVATSVPFVAWSPGGTYDVLGKTDGKPLIEVSGVPTFDTSGELRVTTVSVTRADATLNLPEAVLSQILPDREVMPREAVYPAGQSADEIQQGESQAMSTSQQDSIVAALREADVAVLERPMASVIVTSGPADGELEPGDLIVSVDGVPVSTVEGVREQIQTHKVGDYVVFDILRNGEPRDATVVTQASNTTPSIPTVGVGWATGYSYDASIKINLDSSIGGPSAGLIFALAVYDKITSYDLIAGRSIAGTGQISTDGKVGQIGGIREKISGAQKAGATIFLVPADNCDAVVGVQTSMKLVKVSTLREAIDALQDAKDPNATLPSCNG